MKSSVLAVLAVLVVLSPPPPKDSLDRVVADLWQYRLAHDPSVRLQRGLPVQDLPQISAGSSRNEVAVYRAFLERLARIDPASLEHEEWLTRAVLRWELDQAVEAADHLALDAQITPYTFPLLRIQEIFKRHTFSSREDLDRYLRLLRQYPRYVTQIQARAEWQRSRGFLIPRETVDQMVPRSGASSGSRAPSVGSTTSCAPTPGSWRRRRRRSASASWPRSGASSR